jgi:hypothetical protein
LKNKQQAVMDAKLSGYGFLANLVHNKKRKIDEISNSAATNVGGKFMYKFKEGHSKNFKRELTFDYFLA